MGRLVKRGTWAVAILCVVAAAGLAQDAAALLKQGEQQKRAKQYSAAAKTLEAALKLSPDNGRAHYLLAWSLIKSNQREAALPHLQEAIRLLPGTPEAKEAGDALKRMGQPATGAVPASGPTPAAAPGAAVPPPAPAASAPGALPGGPAKSKRQSTLFVVIGVVVLAAGLVLALQKKKSGPAEVGEGPESGFG